MPHVVIKALTGLTREQYKQAAEEIAGVLERTMGKPVRLTSVSMEEYTRSEWVGVYNEYVKDKDNVVLMPGYTDPETLL